MSIDKNRKAFKKTLKHDFKLNNNFTISGEKYTGNLSEVNKDNVKIEWISREPKPIGKGKISVKRNKSLSFNEIKEAKLILEF